MFTKGQRVPTLEEVKSLRMAVEEHLDNISVLITGSTLREERIKGESIRAIRGLLTRFVRSVEKDHQPESTEEGRALTELNVTARVVAALFAFGGEAHADDIERMVGHRPEWWCNKAVDEGLVVFRCDADGTYLVLTPAGRALFDRLEGC